MKITHSEIRRNPDKLLEALEKSEVVTLLHRGQEIAHILPAKNPNKVIDHPAFGMWRDRDGMDPRAFRLIHHNKSR